MAKDEAQTDTDLGEAIIDDEDAGFAGTEEGVEDAKPVGKKAGKALDEDGDEGGEEGGSEPKTAAEIAAELGDSLGGEEEPTPKPGKQTPKPGAEEEAGKKTKLTKERLSEIISMVSDEDLPDKTVIIGDEEINLAAYRKEYPDEFNAMKVVSGIMAEKMVAKIIESQGYVKASDVASEVGELKSTIDQMLFMSTVQGTHADALTIVKTPEYKKWFGNQPKKIQMLSDSSNPQHAIALLNYYKEDTAKANVEEIDKKNQDKHNKKVGVHKASLRSITSKDTSKKTVEDKDDESEGFDEYNKSKAS
jgi:hypothetical protein